MNNYRIIITISLMVDIVIWKERKDNEKSNKEHYCDLSLYDDDREPLIERDFEG